MQRRRPERARRPRHTGMLASLQPAPSTHRVRGVRLLHGGAVPLLVRAALRQALVPRLERRLRGAAVGQQRAAADTASGRLGAWVHPRLGGCRSGSDRVPPTPAARASPSCTSPVPARAPVPALTHRGRGGVVHGQARQLLRHPHHARLVRHLAHSKGAGAERGGAALGCGCHAGREPRGRRELRAGRQPGTSRTRDPAGACGRAARLDVERVGVGHVRHHHLHALARAGRAVGGGGATGRGTALLLALLRRLRLVLLPDLGWGRGRGVSGRVEVWGAAWRRGAPHQRRLPPGTRAPPAPAPHAP